MNFGDMKTEVARILGNMQSSDILYGDLGKWVNDSIDSVITMAYGGNRANLNLFPELLTDWDTSGPTISGDNEIDMPVDALVVTDVSSYDSSAAITRATTKLQPLSFVPWKHFRLLQKDSTVKGYPRIWSWRGRTISIWPTPSTDYLTYINIAGCQKEPALSSAADTTMVTNAKWHNVFVNRAAAEGALKKGWSAKHQELMKAVKDEVQLAVSLKGLYNAATPSAVSVDGMPTRNSVHG